MFHNDIRRDCSLISIYFSVQQIHGEEKQKAVVRGIIAANSEIITATNYIDRADDFKITNCWDKKSYIIIKDDSGEDLVYYIYNLNGKRVGALNESMIVGSIGDYICY